MEVTDYDYRATRNEIIQRAFRIVGVLGDGEVLGAEQLANGIEALNGLVAGWQADHIFLWTTVPLTQALTASDVDYTLKDDPLVLWIDKASLIDASNVETPLSVISKAEYELLTDKTIESTPTSVAIDGAEPPVLYVWPAPDTTYTLSYTAVTKHEDWDTAAGTGSFPVRFTDALVYGLANRLCDEYPVELGRIGRIEKMAMQEFFKIKKSDRARTDTTYIESAY